MKLFMAVMVVACLTLPAAARPALAPDLASVSFLVGYGHWMGFDGKVSGTGGMLKGYSEVTVEANGAAILRRHNTVNHPDGFDQVMLIYPEGGTLHADYMDGEHIIHYTNATVVPGKSVTFKSAPSASSPQFQLRYEVLEPHALTVTFGMIPPGQTVFRPIATGALREILG